MIAKRHHHDREMRGKMLRIDVLPRLRDL